MSSPGWQHFEIERRLLDLGGSTLRSAILALRAAGEKAEPAFATLLDLPGDPYRAMSELFGLPDDALAEFLTKRGFKSGPKIIELRDDQSEGSETR